MLSVLALALALTVGFLVVLFHFDLAPKAALFRIISRFAAPPESLRPIKRDAPYNRTKASSKSAHLPILLNLPTSDGSGQACHPDVAYVPEGFGYGKWPYWMACTPYAYGEGAVENPEIFVSYDGIAWSVPEGGRNPLAPTPKDPGDHNSDPDLLFFNNQLWLYYRETLRSKSPKKIPDTNNIYLTKSSDGIRWSAPVKILSDAGTGRELLSPAILHDRSRFLMWTVEVADGELTIFRRTSADGFAWSAPQPAALTGLPPGRHPWHLDVIQEPGRLSAALVSSTGLYGRGSRLHYACSEDHGFTWLASGFLFEQAYEFEASLQYRATLCKTDAQNPEYQFWYSASSLTNMFSIAYLRMTRMENQLRPTSKMIEHTPELRARARVASLG